MSNRKTILLGDICEITSSKRVKMADYVDAGVPFYRSKEIIEKSNGNDISTELFISHEHFEKIKSKFGAPIAGDILLTSVGTLGIPYQVKTKDKFYFKDGNLTWFRNFSDRVNPKFLYYWLSSPVAKRKFDEVTIGSTQKALTIVALKSIEIELPSIQVQNHIVIILDSLNSKLSNNRQTNQILEQIAQAIFKSWFVNFEPTRAKVIVKQKGGDEETQALAAQAILCGAITLADLNALSNEPSSLQSALSNLIHSKLITQNTDKSSHNWLPEQLISIAELFPNTVIDSELGEVPEGWEIGELRKIADFSTDRISATELTIDNYISTENMLEGKKGISTAASLPSVKTVPRFEAGQVLISNIRPYFMKIWLASFSGGRSNDVLGIKANDPDGVQYLYNLLYQDSFFNFMMTTSKGAKMPRGDKEAIMGWTCVQPSKSITKAYSRIVGTFSKIIVSNNKENEILDKTRDTILPKLLSGELSVSTEQLDELQDDRVSA